MPPGPSGAPTRGTADVLPTGRNFYSLDVRAVPTPTAWRVGCAAADALLERHRERTGRYPESIALVIWGTSNMRTGGDDIAEVLHLLGVRPRWDEANRRVVGVEVVPLTELGRPRIDVTVRISGLFRDAFPNLVRLLNEAIQMVARLEEPLDWNFLRAAIARDTARLSHGDALPVEEAARRASLRVFGSKPGAYGAGLLPLIDARNWQSVQDLADVYLTWSSFAYTGDRRRWPRGTRCLCPASAQHRGRRAEPGQPRARHLRQRRLLPVPRRPHRRRAHPDRQRPRRVSRRHQPARRRQGPRPCVRKRIASFARASSIHAGSPA